MLRRCAFLFLSLGLLAGCRHREPSPTASHQELPPTVSKNPVAVIHTTAGDMTCELFPKEAPKTVANFIGLAEGTKDWKDARGTVQHNKPLYDGVIFHRVIPGFMIQGGDPTGTGAGDPGFTFEDELHADLVFDRPGRLAMANRGPNTNTSQFFITEREQPALNPCLRDEGCPEVRRGKNTGYTIFGQCDASSVELEKQIARMDRNENDRPYDPVKIRHIDILNLKTTTQPSPSTPKK
ncbi:MAG TPA: peptidylprolyl isomerase [Candidatus Angelobacter sp.]|nr:peptidylprolyl isomerase [Candidatus Angelobacter sp.]